MWKLDFEQCRADPPDQFDFPFTPYPIQHEFMSKLYEVIENRKFGIFESPTGTVSVAFFYFNQNKNSFSPGKIAEHNLWSTYVAQRLQYKTAFKSSRKNQ